MKNSIEKISFMLFAVLLTSIAHASVVLTWTAPTTRANGDALTAAEIAGYTITKNGVALGSVTGLTYTDTAGRSCVLDTYGVIANDTGGLASAPALGTITIDKVKCAPSAPTGLKVSGG